MVSIFKKVKALGYDSVHGYAPPFITLEDYRNAVGESGLENCSSNGDIEEMKAGAAGIKKAIEAAHFLGKDQVSIGTLPKKYRESKEGYKKFASECNAVSKKLKKEGLKLLYHPHAIEFYSLGGGLKGMDIIVNETDPEGLWFCLDTHWLAAGGVDPVEWIKKVKGRMNIVHFKDYAIVKAAIDRIEEVHKQFAEVGEGNLNWPEIIKACKSIKVKHAVVEQDICPGNPLDSLKTSIRNMIKFGV
jgi:sugar phosphate isomerase/epimerase